MSDGSDDGITSSNTYGSDDRYTETTTQGWFSRIFQSLAGLIVGPILLLVGIGLLVWNEDRAVTTARSLSEGLGAVVTVDAAQPQPQNEGHLVHVVGMAAANGKLTDTDFRLSVEGLVLRRHVEMMQWREKEETHTEKNVGGSTTTTKTYTYSRVWSANLINYGQFKQPQGHANPAFAIASRSQTARDAHVGGFRLEEKLLQALPSNEPVRVDPTSLDAVKMRLGRPITDTGSNLFVGTDPAVPEIGDLRITFTRVPAGPITVIAAQLAGGFAPYQTKAGDQIAEIRLGTETPQQIFRELENNNTIVTWVLRAVGAVLELVGFGLCFAPLSVLADVLPFLGNLVGLGTGFLAVSLTFVVVPITIALAWLAFRPLVSGAVLGAGVLGVVAVKLLWPRKAAVR